MHLSFSDRIIGGWGETDGPDSVDDPNWQIGSYTISRYNQNGIIKSFGDTPVPFTVPNTASATGTDLFGQGESKDVTSTEMSVKIVDPSLVFPENDAVDFKNREAWLKFVSKNPEAMVIKQIEISFPEAINGDLKRIQLGKDTMWSDNLEGPTLILCVDACEPDTLELDGVLTAATLEALSREKLRFSSANRPVADPDPAPYTFVVTFADGTEVSITTGS